MIPRMMAAAVVLAAVLPASAQNQDKTLDRVRTLKCQALIKNLAVAATAYELDNAVYPPSGNAALVKALQQKGAKRGPYIDLPAEMINASGEVLDPWGRPLVYINNIDKSGPKDWKAKHPNSFDLYSFGANAKDDRGEPDDVINE